MSDPPQNLQLQRAIEDKLIHLGTERSKIERSVSDNIQAITDAVDAAISAGISVERIAQLVRVSRQTLYRWKEGAVRMS